ncbi:MULTISPECIES: glycine cleavage system aminomethyltransferase GcvT [Halolamina]|uniref:Probable aminomethyltransferase n=1 Tax=Halolamina pelagica TaxID=699431 RepID=A0A1I5Q356_9EURY|nr:MULTISPECIES: glycine cleavage system aminomethyltransferase GcvT [Halolamina]NHX35066.1 glycine cleavage system aminomethyltransferase GcvT [Halolamina sp. R1-12]SFP40401.1 aminomethyltransferase [Halolamina pelagica]
MVTRRPPLYEVHEDRGAGFTDFGGWEMPVEFDSIRAEHTAVREAAGIFDVSHMGEIRVEGPDAETLMQRLTTNDIASMDPGDAQYACITDEDGVIHDDTMTYRLPGGDYLFVPNAGHDEEAEQRWVDYRDGHDLDAEVSNETADWAMFAVQGPDAVGLAADAVDALGAPLGEESDDLADLSRFTATRATVAGVDCLVARTGYTGEDGVEILCDAEDAEVVWGAFDCQPCGLGARDTLRMEQGLLLSGQDFHPEENPRTPYEAGVGFTVDLDTEFVGRDALAAQQEAGVDETFIGLTLQERGVARHGYEITHDGETVGEVTSGTMSPTLDEAIALGYLPTELAEDGTEVAVVIRGEEKRAEVTTPPFIDQ